MSDGANTRTVEHANRLMARVQEHDIAAFEVIYDGYHRLVYGIALRMLDDPCAAEDVTQAVFLKIWSDPQLFKSGNFSGWLTRVTRNRCLDILRRKSSTDVALPEERADEGILEERALAELDATRVRKALAQLAAEQREPIELGFFVGVTHEEIARRTNVPLGTVKTRIRAGLRRLRVLLQGAVTV